MNVASLELCRELYELSGWDDCDFSWKYGSLTWGVPAGTQPIGKDDNTPMYDLGYLLRKLYQTAPFIRYDIEARPDVGYPAMKFFVMAMQDTNGEEIDVRQWADTPEDAACKLCCELIRQGVIKP